MDRARHLIVVSDADADAGERWPRFVETLRDELRASGLGELWSDGFSEHVVGAREAVVSLNHPDYGRNLVDQLISSFGLPSRAVVLPRRWKSFNCTDYFESDFARRGCADTTGFPFVLRCGDVYEDDELELLVIGSPGCDGIVWGYRPERVGIWAWYPIDSEFVLVAPNVQALAQGWTTGRITV
jgi:hypothetical protein